MTELDKVLDREASKLQPSTSAWERLQTRAARRRHHRRIGTVAVAACVGFAGVGVVVKAFDSRSGGMGAPSAGEIVRYRIDGAPQPMVVGDGAAWVEVTAMTPKGTGPATIWRIDAQTGDAKPLRGTTGTVWVAVGDGGVWATCGVRCGGPGLLQLDPATGDVIQRVQLRSTAIQIAVGLGDVWVTTDQGLVKVDASSGAVLSTYPGNYNRVGTSAHSVWASTPSGIVQINPETGTRMLEVPFPNPCYLAVSIDAALVSSCGGADHETGDELLAVDATSGQTRFRVPVDRWGGPLQIDGRTAFMLQGDPMNPGYLQIMQMDIETGDLLGPPYEVELGTKPRFFLEGFAGPSPFFGVGEAAAWISDFGSGEVIRVGLPISGRGMQTPQPSPISSPVAPPSAASDNPVVPGFQPSAIAFWDSSRGLITGSESCPTSRCEGAAPGGRIAMTGDGGRTWKTVERSAPTTGVATFGADEAWVTTVSGVLHTADGGKTWSKISDANLSHPTFSNSSDGWATSGSPDALRLEETSDGGRTWHRIPSPCHRTLTGLPASQFSHKVVFLWDLSNAGLGSGWVFCSNGGYNTVAQGVFSTQDHGATWTQRWAGFGGLAGMQIRPDGSGMRWNFISADLEGTTDGGVTWHRLGTTGLAPAVSISLLSGVSAVALTQSAHGDVLLQTADGGHSWTVVTRFPRN